MSEFDEDRYFMSFCRFPRSSFDLAGGEASLETSGPIVAFVVLLITSHSTSNPIYGFKGGGGMEMRSWLPTCRRFCSNELNVCRNPV